MLHTVSLRLNATIEIFNAGSREAAERIARDLLDKRFLTEFPVRLRSSERAGKLHLAFDAKPLVGVIGEGEDPAPNP